MPRAASASGSTCTRTVGCSSPPIPTRPTPDICEIFCSNILFAYASTTVNGKAVGSDPKHQYRRFSRVDLADQTAGKAYPSAGTRSQRDRRQRVAHRPIYRTAQFELQGDLDIAERARRRIAGDLPRTAAPAATLPWTPSSVDRRQAVRTVTEIVDELISEASIQQSCQGCIEGLNSLHPLQLTKNNQTNSYIWWIIGP